MYQIPKMLIDKVLGKKWNFSKKNQIDKKKLYLLTT